MRKGLALLTGLLLLHMGTTMAQPRRQFLQPSGTFTYATADDGRELKLDIYDPAQDSQTTLDGKPNPTLLYFFGGGFAGGSKSDIYFRGWIGQMTQAGYRVVVPDYRLGLQGTKHITPSVIKKAYKAVVMAVEDAVKATDWLAQHADSLNLDPANIVICGSSAGAVISLQSTYESRFPYAGVISWSGGISTRTGRLKYTQTPPPTLFFHGTADKVVPFGRIKFAQWGFIGPQNIMKEFDKSHATYHIYRYQDHVHEVATIMSRTVPEQLRFLEDAVMRQQKDTLDRTVAGEWLRKSDRKITNIYK